MSEILLNVDDLSIVYKTAAGEVRAVNNISFAIEKGKTLGLVGETGAGKTTTALGILRLLPARTAEYRSGTVTFEGQNLLTLSDKEMYGIRGRKISMVFQDPMTALNPIMNVNDQIAEAIQFHSDGTLKREEVDKRVDDILELVGIPASRKKEYPHQFSGGMKQRIVIAIALVCEPALLIADEPTSALDVTMQAQVLAMIMELKKKINTSMLMISHDLGVIARTCDEVAVMYAGEIIEMAPTDMIFTGERHHPYTVGLMNSLPSVSGNAKRLKPIEGMMPDPTDLPAGCKFAPRCPFCEERCKIELPPCTEQNGHLVRCHRFA